MKTKIIVFVLIFLITVLSYSKSFSADKEKYGFNVSSPNEELYGTWVNPDYIGYGTKLQKWVYYHWGYYEGYGRINDTNPYARGTSMIVDKWTDSKGNIWVKEYERETWTLRPIFMLDRISNSGNVFEYVWSQEDFPKEADFESKNAMYNYCIYKRQ
jgi:hypothetical protein